MQGTILPGITRKGIMEIAQDCGYEVNDYTLSDTSGFCFFFIIIIIISSTNACWVRACGFRSLFSFSFLLTKNFSYHSRYSITAPKSLELVEIHVVELSV
jgi:hypothetical protein